MKFLPIFNLIVLFCISTSAKSDQQTALPLENIQLPPGFSISVWAEVPDARAMALGDDGTVFVGSKSAGNVYAITEKSGKRQVRVIADRLKMPTGIAFHEGALYIAAVDKILRIDNIENTLDKPAAPHIINADYPSETIHAQRYIAAGPDGWLYVSIGSPCNVCEADPTEFAIISRIRPDGSEREVFAQGVRNSLGFDWHPVTGDIWFTNNNRDWMGEDLPPHEMNHAPRPGLHFGFPYCHGSTLLDPKFGAKRGCNKSTPPAAELDPHVTPMGMRFYTGSLFPERYRNQIIMAEHGSWNRRVKVGHRLLFVQLEADQVVSKEVFAEGWLIAEQNQAWGSPVDVLVMPDGALLVSDDTTGAIYRISYDETAIGQDEDN
ncbi:PQQ-dependent sugar dehydrogenase [Nitrosomonas halophila]|uniref:Pyrroloquinoline quinone-dependent pyranose dehydrogenase beta-propeller domain-containing protein n=1 Tax=Nitrosomonas halophila TaxID=44576 RepID=A0A1H3CIE5_9PROT|nr:PQQ-dependent sugar dehydrogenase [Nitrosomonas halophila]SDX53668.1 hypothetical protein SAMN05421881_100325 [Nitrosomonas halophila]